MVGVSSSSDQSRSSERVRCRPASTLAESEWGAIPLETVRGLEDLMKDWQRIGLAGRI